MRNVYVYYRIAPGCASLAATRVDALLAMMAGVCGEPPRRGQRCDDPDTWMEIYADIEDRGAFDAALNHGVKACRCAEFTLGERRMECFLEQA